MQTLSKGQCTFYREGENNLKIHMEAQKTQKAKAIS
jgi:hypothetical protein